MRQQLELRGLDFTTTNASIEEINKIKEKHCRVAQDFDAEHKTCNDNKENHIVYQLPKGQITLKLEPIQTPELMFQPAKNDKAFDGIHKFTHDSIMK